MAAITYKCPNCDGGLIFDPDSQKYRCEYCLSDFTQEEVDALKPDSDKAVLYNCPSCGAQIVAEATTTATFCYYCHNPVVLAGRLEGEFQPDYVIPFQIDRERAEEIFAQWIRKKKYVPKAFYDKRQIETMKGVYFPYWIYNCKVDGVLDAQGTRLRTWDTAGLRYTETKIYDIKRQGTIEVGDVARSGLRKANRRLVEGVMPYRMEEKKKFSMGYLSGFLAENRDMKKEEFVTDVRMEVREFALSSLESQAGEYARMKIDRREANLRDENWGYALLPVWTLTYNDKARGRIYYFALNGQTGKICGQLPVDNKKLGALFLSIFLPLAALFLIGGYFLI